MYFTKSKIKNIYFILKSQVLEIEIIEINRLNRWCVNITYQELFR